MLVTVVGGAASIPGHWHLLAPIPGSVTPLAAAAGGLALGRLPAGQGTVFATCGGGASPLRQSMPLAGTPMRRASWRSRLAPAT